MLTTRRRDLRCGHAWPVHRPSSPGRIAATAASAWSDAWRTRRSVRVRVLNCWRPIPRDLGRRGPRHPPDVWAMRLRAQKGCPGWSPDPRRGRERGALGDLPLAPRGHASTLTLSAPTDRRGPGHEQARVHPERVCKVGAGVAAGRRDARISRSSTWGCSDQSMVMEYRSTKRWWRN
jgi:hypothetical protein